MHSMNFAQAVMLRLLQVSGEASESTAESAAAASGRDAHLARWTLWGFRALLHGFH